MKIKIGQIGPNFAHQKNRSLRKMKILEQLKTGAKFATNATKYHNPTKPYTDITIINKTLYIYKK